MDIYRFFCYDGTIRVSERESHEPIFPVFSVYIIIIVPLPSAAE
jgi:hypothetical protein